MKDNGNYLIYDGTTLVKGKLNGNGSFDSEECIKYLEQSDIVVTNPPFSLFREYVDVLFAFNKKFCILGNMNAITYNEIFPHIKNGEMWLGKSLNGSKCSFIVPETYENQYVWYENGKKYAPINNSMWFTNMENNKQANVISLIKKYIEEEYPKYDNYNAINVNKAKEIPYDYDGVIGVPITALNYLCSDGLLHFDTPIKKKR